MYNDHKTNSYDKQTFINSNINNNNDTLPKTRIPFMPILGPKPFSKILEDIYNSIIGEATAAEFYSRLLKDAPDDLHREFIQHAYEDELKHLEAFSLLYYYFTRQNPQFNITYTQYSDYKNGLLTALKGEIEGAGFYRDVQLSTSDHLIKDVFFLAMTDETEHSVQFSTLYNTL